MASILNHNIFTVNEIVKFKEKTCLITNIHNIFGFNQYELVDIDTGNEMRAHGYQLSRSDTADLIDAEFVEEIGLIGNEHTSVKTPVTVPAEESMDTVPNPRWAKISEQDIDALAENRHSHHTSSQTKWATAAFKGKILPNCTA